MGQDIPSVVGPCGVCKVSCSVLNLFAFQVCVGPAMANWSVANGAVWNFAGGVNGRDCWQTHPESSFHQSSPLNLKNYEFLLVAS